MEADNVLFAGEQKPSASADVTREIETLKAQLAQLKTRLANYERCAD